MRAMALTHALSRAENALGRSESRIRTPLPWPSPETPVPLSEAPVPISEPAWLPGGCGRSCRGWMRREAVPWLRLAKDEAHAGAVGECEGERGQERERERGRERDVNTRCSNYIQYWMSMCPTVRAYAILYMHMSFCAFIRHTAHAVSSSPQGSLHTHHRSGRVGRPALRQRCRTIPIQCFQGAPRVHRAPPGVQGTASALGRAAVPEPQDPRWRPVPCQ